MPRLMLTLALTVPFLALGAPLCCFVGASCCHIAPPVESAPAPGCSCCPVETEPEPAPQPPRTPSCDCSDHPIDLAPADALPAAAAVPMAWLATTVEPFPLVREAATTAPVTPPRAPAALTLPLLL